MRGRTEIITSAFRQGVTVYFQSGEILIEEGELSRHLYLLRTGLAYQSCWFSERRRAIVDIFSPGNVVGLETILSARASGSVTAAGPVKCLGLDASSLRQLLEDREIP